MEQNLNLYHIFATVAKCRNISAAARELYISQPAISKAISRLESNLNTSLFVRSSRGVKLTESGEILYHQVETAFSAISQGEEQLRKIHELGIGHLSIGVSSTLCKYVLLPYLSNFTKENPHIQISISCQSSYQTFQALENGSVDIGLVGEYEKQDKIEFVPLMEIQDCFVCTQRYLDNLYKRFSFSVLNDSSEILSHANLMLLDKENITRQYVEKYLFSEHISAAQTLEVTSMDLLIEFARIDLGVACVIRNFIQEDLDCGRLIELPLPIAIPPRRIGFAFSNNSARTSAFNKFTENAFLINGKKV